MSQEASAWAWRQNLQHNLKFLLVALADNADYKTRMCTLEVADLSELTGIPEPGVRARLASLTEIGLIQPLDTRAGMKNPMYVLLVGVAG